MGNFEAEGLASGFSSMKLCALFQDRVSNSRLDRIRDFDDSWTAGAGVGPDLGLPDVTGVDIVVVLEILEVDEW